MERLTIDEVIKVLKSPSKHIYTVTLDGEPDVVFTSQMAKAFENSIKALEELKDYKDAEEDGLLPKFHLGDEFWCLYIDKVVKAKIVSLQQKKDGSWNYTLSREISENYHDIAYYKERKYGKYFWSTKSEAEQALAKMKGE